VQEEEGDGAILIPRCGFMNKISGLSDGGVWGWRTMYREAIEGGEEEEEEEEGRKGGWRGPTGSREVALPMVSR